ncbi:substrate-binding domain-containing protein [Arthrobacter sp. Helios]|uniref:substrate-binding domain-containing protein n=1 Tax=Arthrobacter sp. Helios TaxID=2828862 RepID=UPI002046468A|nr:substrate-binding domain-containing protein [Arthrobacter sp. Helios]UPO76634.1 substrate-binding domain-containing protein [Arthrobacter sp. Helios]
MSQESLPPSGSAAPPLKIAYVPGVTPGKWISRWMERRQRSLEAEQVDETAVLARLESASADLVFLRIPEAGFQRPEGQHAIPLYLEQPVVAAPKDHPVAAFEEVELADLAGENLMEAAELGGTAMALEVVASGAGLLILPMPVARIHSRRDIISRPVHGVEGTRIAVAWREDAEDPDIEEFIGIVRGRTANSSRQPSAQSEPVKTRKSKAGKSAEGKPVPRTTGGRPGAGKPVRKTGKNQHGTSDKAGSRSRRRPGKGRG